MFCLSGDSDRFNDLTTRILFVCKLKETVNAINTAVIPQVSLLRDQPTSLSYLSALWVSLHTRLFSADVQDYVWTL